MTKKNAAFNSIESVEQIFAHTMPSGANAISWTELESSLRLAGKLFAFEQRARNLFKEIETELGVDRAKFIFGALASASGCAPRSKRQVEKYNNVLLLMLYIEHRLPVQQFARRLADGNQDYPGPFGLGYRNGTAEAIEQQLKRLLKKDPTKEDSTLMRLLLADAQRVHQELGVKPGRPRLRK